MEKPMRPLISVTKFNLSAVLKENVYVGFSASTGSQAIEDHHILGWSFSTEGKAPTVDLSDLPSLIRKKQTTKSVGFMGLSIPYDVSYLDYGTGVVHATTSTSHPTTSTSNGFGIDSDYDVAVESLYLFSIEDVD
ncbi:hypothetical protein SUGI_0559000 [Cryptomeria japonica]|nr:hypothetical protein SUGI_0559000 [Cryptomeria japonica]